MQRRVEDRPSEEESTVKRQRTEEQEKVDVPRDGSQMRNPSFTQRGPSEAKPISERQSIVMGIERALVFRDRDAPIMLFRQPK